MSAAQWPCSASNKNFQVPSLPSLPWVVRFLSFFYRCQCACGSERLRRRRTPPSPRLPCVTTCLAIFLAWRLCPVRLCRVPCPRVHFNIMRSWRQVASLRTASGVGIPPCTALRGCRVPCQEQESPVCAPDRPSKILLVQVGTLSSSPIPRLGCCFLSFCSTQNHSRRPARLPPCRRVRLCPIREGNPWDPVVWVNPAQPPSKLHVAMRSPLPFLPCCP